MSYRVWGYTDEDPESPTIIAVFDTQAKAIDFAELSMMSVEVEDHRTGQIVWMYEVSQWASARKAAVDAR